MKPTYLVTESAVNAEVLKRLLPVEVAQNTEFVAAKGKYSARSLAGTILSEKMRPVVLVVDADTEDATTIQEQTSTVASLLYPASPGVAFEVVLAVPTVTAILPKNLTLLQSKPHAVEQLDNLNTEQIHTFRQHPLIQQITQFVANVLSQVA